jgi:hypothetical protein
MARVSRPLRGAKSASRRSSPGEGTKEIARDRLTLVHAHAHQPHPHRGMWNDDPLADPTELTRLADWPDDSEFEPLIASARSAGNHILVAQLEADRAFCAAAREHLRRPEDVTSGSTA